MILAGARRELGLQEDLSAHHQALAIRRGERVPYRGLDVMPSLVRRVDAPEARSKRTLGERTSTLFLPRGAIQEPRYGGWVGRSHRTVNHSERNSPRHPLR